MEGKRRVSGCVGLGLSLIDQGQEASGDSQGLAGDWGRGPHTRPEAELEGRGGTCQFQLL